MTEPASAQRPFLPNSFVPSLKRVAVILAPDHRRVSDDDSLDLLLHHFRESALLTTDLEHPTRAISLLLWVFSDKSVQVMLYSVGRRKVPPLSTAAAFSGSSGGPTRTSP